MAGGVNNFSPQQNWQSLGGNGLYGYNNQGGAGIPVARDEMDASRIGVGRIPSAEYPQMVTSERYDPVEMIVYLIQSSLVSTRKPINVAYTKVSVLSHLCTSGPKVYQICQVLNVNKEHSKLLVTE